MIPIIEVSKVFTKTLISFDQIFTKPIEVWQKQLNLPLYDIAKYVTLVIVYFKVEMLLIKRCSRVIKVITAKLV